MTTPIYGLLLVGGKSSRMGTDKALLRFNSGQTQLERSAGLLLNTCSRAFVSLRPDQSFPLPESVEPLFDSMKDIHGPLCGILSAMKAHPNAHWLVLACDLPNLNSGVLDKLIQAFKCLDVPQLTAYRSSHDQLPEPLCAIYPAGIAEELKVLALDIGKFCPRKLLIIKEAILIDQDDPSSLDNINSKDDLKDYLSGKQP